MYEQWTSFIVSGVTCYTPLSACSQLCWKATRQTGPYSGSWSSHHVRSAAHSQRSYRSYDGYNYDPSYTSHSHGWSTGPTSALTFYVLGLTVTSPQGRTWSVAPHISGLQSAEGGFETPLGWYGVEWTLTAKDFHLTLDTPAGSSGIIMLPVSGTVFVNGDLMQIAHMPLFLNGGRHAILVQLE